VRAGDETTDEVPTGSWLIKPRSIPHAMWNTSNQAARLLEVVLPGGIEHYFHEIAPLLKQRGSD